MINVVLNAFEAVAEARKSARDAAITAARREPEWVEVAVRDSGNV